MEVINGKTYLRIDGQVFRPGQKCNIPDNVAEKLSQAGMVEKATRGPVEKAVMPEPVESSLDTLTVAKLKQMCKQKGLPVYGTKAELIARLEGD